MTSVGVPSRPVVVVPRPLVWPRPVDPGRPGGQPQQREQNDQHGDERVGIPEAEGDPEPDDQDGQHWAEPAAQRGGRHRQRLLPGWLDLGFRLGNLQPGLLGQVTGEIAEPAPGLRGERDRGALVELLQGQPPGAESLAQDLDDVLTVGVRGADTAVIRHVRTSPKNPVRHSPLSSGGYPGPVTADPGRVTGSVAAARPVSPPARPALARAVSRAAAGTPIAGPAWPSVPRYG